MGSCSMASSQGTSQSDDYTMTLTTGCHLSSFEHEKLASTSPGDQSIMDEYMTSQSNGYYDVAVQSTNNAIDRVTTDSLHDVILPSAAFRSYPRDVNCTECHSPDPDLDSPSDRTDFERCGLDYEPDSSEDELTIINCGRDQPTLKRKWSRVSRCNSCEDNSESSDEDIRDSTKTPKLLKFCSSPPKGVHKLRHTLSPAQFMANLSSRTIGVCCVPPRKRQRQATSAEFCAASAIQRPCLDFEKMRLHWLRHNIKHRRRRITPQ